MRTIHYSIRLAIVLIMTSLFYGSVTFLFHQAVQIPALLTLLFIAFCAERLWVLLEWIGPVVGTANLERQERNQKRIVEYLLQCSLRYDSSLVIAAIRGKKRMSLHVVSHLLRKTDIVLRSSAGYLLVLMPFTTIEQAGFAFKRLSTQLPIKDIVVTDVTMLQAVMGSQGTGEDGEMRSATPRELRKFCFLALDAKVASITSSEDETNAPVVYRLFEPEASESLQSWLEAFSHSKPASDVHPEVREEITNIIASL